MEVLMKKRFAFAFICVLSISPAAFCTDLAECYQLNEYFNKSPSEIHAKIGFYQARFAANKKDYYSNLAMAVLYTALSSPMDNPEPGASDKIVEYSKLFEAKEKNNPIAMTYYGMGCSLVSRDSKNPMYKLLMVKKGIALFDNAVKLSKNQPIEWFVRYMRGNFYINLPDTFDKRSVAEEDFTYVLARYRNNPDIEGYMCNGFYYLGEIEKSRGNMDQAMQYWNQSVAINDKLKLNSKEAKKSSERLSLFKD
jgi:tetratricopeptide (TPR) repeat protein